MRLFGKTQGHNVGPATVTITDEVWRRDSVELHVAITELRLTMEEYEAMDDEAQDRYRSIVRFVETSEIDEEEDADV